MRNLPQLLRDAERRVNAHVWPNRPETLGRDSHLVSIPANRDTDTDLLLIEAADRIRDLEASLNSLWPGLVLDLRHADMDDDIDALRSRVDTVREVLCYAPSPPAPAYPGSTTDSEDVPRRDSKPAKDYPAWFGAPTLIDRIDESVERGIGLSMAIAECAQWAELRSEVIEQLRAYYARETKGK